MLTTAPPHHPRLVSMVEKNNFTTHNPVKNTQGGSVHHCQGLQSRDYFVMITFKNRKVTLLENIKKSQHHCENMMKTEMNLYWNDEKSKA